MLRVTTLYASSAAATAAYYTRYLAEAPAEIPGVWTGRQADALGLNGQVDAEALRGLLEGRDPVSGTRLGYPLLARTLTDGRVVKAVAGFDATFSAPKSMSVLSPPATRRAASGEYLGDQRPPWLPLCHQETHPASSPSRSGLS